MTTRLAKSTTAGVLLAGLVVSGAARAQQDSIREEIVAIKARHILTMSGAPIMDGVILLRNGKISAVGKTVKIPVGARVISADTVMPGIVAPYSQLGLSAAGAGGAPVQLPRGIPPQFAARFQGGGGRASANTHYKVLDELYPFEEAYGQIPRAGVTTLALVPESRGFSGQGAVVKPVGDSAEKMALAQAAPFAINFASDTPTQDLIRSTLQGGGATGGGGGAGFGGRGGRGGAGGNEPDSPGTDDEEDFQGRRGGQFRPPAGGPVSAPSSLSLTARRAAVTRSVSGEVPTFISCTDSSAVIYALSLFQVYDKMKPVYVLPLECYRVADLLGEKKASVIIPADTTFEPNTRNRVNTAAVLSKAGVKIACRPAADSVRGYEGLLSKMAELVKSGLDRDTALKAVTLNPAEMLGVEGRVGSIQTGRDGNLLFLDGDPLSPLTKVTRVMIEGTTVYDGR